MDQPEKKKHRIFDKILMGAVIGGAIGSVLGASIAPKKGSETRQDIVDTAKKAKKGSGLIIRFIKKLLLRKKPEEETEQKKIPQEHV